MKMMTLQFGEIEVNERDVVTFSQGVPGFEKLKRFVFIQPDEELPFFFMQSVEDGDIAFLVTNPFTFVPSYEFTLPDSIQEELGIESEEEVAIWSIVTVKGSLPQSTFNLLAPIVVNAKARLGRQIILHDTSYRLQHPLGAANEKSPESTKEGGHARINT